MSRLFPGAHGLKFAPTHTTRVMQDLMAFLIKSFFFFLIGLMFPTELKQITLAAIGVLFLMAMRVPAAVLSPRNMGLGKKEFWFVSAATSRGLAAAAGDASDAIRDPRGRRIWRQPYFAAIVLSFLVFAIGFAIVGRLPDDHPLIGGLREDQAPH